MDKDYISARDAAKMANMSPGRFVDLLRKERKHLPVEINEDAIKGNPGAFFATRALRSLYSGDPSSIGFLYALKINRLDWEEFLSKRNKEVITPLHSELKKAQTRIAELETELAACREQLEEARRTNPSGMEEVEEFFTEYPVCKLVYDLYLAGKNQAEIRSELTDKGYTNAQTGFLTQEDTLRRSDNAVKQSMKRSKKLVE